MIDDGLGRRRSWLIIKIVVKRIILTQDAVNNNKRMSEDTERNCRTVLERDSFA